MATWDYFMAALGPVLQDVRTDHPGTPLRLVRATEPDLHAWIWMPDGSGIGLSAQIVEGSDEEAFTEAVAALAETVQEAVIECVSMRNGSSTWPPCPAHPDRHPLVVAVHGHAVMWDCPNTERPVAPLGKLRKAG